MNIVILDGYTLNPGDLSWEPLTKLGNVTVHDRSSGDEILERSASAEVVLTNKTPLNAEVIRQLPNLKYIGVLATGYNIVDIQAAAEQGIVVTNVPDYSTHSVAQLVFALLLESCNAVAAHNAAVHDGRWSAGPDFTFTLHPLLELADKTMGIFGFGQIGQQVARVALAFGMKVIVHTRTVKRIDGLEEVRFVSEEELFAESDVVTLHCPLTKETSGMINKRTLGLMKPTSFFINTARGGHVVEQELAEALQEGKIAGAGLDVLSVEPPAVDNPLIGVSNCYITPHIAWETVEARQRLMGIAASNLQAFQGGKDINRVN
ncbi:D-2-hydroxyacid dehydrogenase [Paenibacillus mendelii]|uniref:D-2-hydroxyacid dehydrogenase n=1 Tax=Paenibacillus mendelii TaxID=206163 RepID=A0ABV6JGT1_9BACL|nr:D-2-hydroxyacid dehydrogenase [Paenibacillus mendelii]MCQ6557968.1 D-2-hydroxyacid dehydrogenase [Paenibacillus mendelii]